MVRKSSANNVNEFLSAVSTWEVTLSSVLFFFFFTVDCPGFVLLDSFYTTFDVTSFVYQL